MGPKDGVSHHAEHGKKLLRQLRTACWARKVVRGSKCLEPEVQNRDRAVDKRSPVFGGRPNHIVGVASLGQDSYLQLYVNRLLVTGQAPPGDNRNGGAALLQGLANDIMSSDGSVSTGGIGVQCQHNLRRRPSQ